MSQTTNNQKNATSATGFSIESLRYIENDLNEVIDKLYDLEDRIEDKELKDQLKWRAGDVEDILSEVEERKEKVGALIKSIAS